MAMTPRLSADQTVTGGTSPWSIFTDRQRWLFLLILFLSGTSSAMDRAVISILFEQLKADFQLSDAQLGLLRGAPFGICYALSSLPLARSADRVGRKRVASGPR